MPKIYEYLGLVFYFYSNEHLPIHVHVSFEEFESKIELEYESGKLKELKVLEVKGRNSLPKWTTFFVKNNKVKNEVITQKI